jgi:hypothetical protein
MKWVVKIFTIIFIFASVLLAGSCVQKVDEPKVEEVTTSLADVPLRVPVFKDEGNFALKSIENVDTNNFTATLVYDASNTPNVVKGGVLQLKVDPNDPYSYELLKVVDVKTNGNEIVMEVKQASLVDILPENSHITFGDGEVTLEYVDQNGEAKKAVGPMDLVDVVMVSSDGKKVSIYDEVTNEARRRGLTRGPRGRIVEFVIPLNAEMNFSGGFLSLMGSIRGGVYGDIDISKASLNKIEVYLGGSLDYDLNSQLIGSYSGVSQEIPLSVYYPYNIVADFRTNLLSTIESISNEVVSHINEVVSGLEEASNIVNTASKGFYEIRDKYKSQKDSMIMTLYKSIYFLHTTVGLPTNFEGWVSNFGWGVENTLDTLYPIVQNLSSNAISTINSALGTSSFALYMTSEFLGGLHDQVYNITAPFTSINKITLEYYMPEFSFSIGPVVVIIKGKVGLYNGLEGSWSIASGTVSLFSSSSRSFKTGVGWSKDKGFYGVRDANISFNIDENALRSSSTGTANLKPYIALKASVEFLGDLFSGAAKADIGAGGRLKLYDRYSYSLSTGPSTADVYNGASISFFASLGWSVLWGISSGSSSWQSPEYSLFENKVCSLLLFKGPSFVSASKDRTYGVVLSWNEVSGATVYNVYKVLGGNNYQKIATVSQTNYTDTNAVFGDNYYVIKAYSPTYGESAPSPIVVGVRTRPVVYVPNPSNNTLVGLDLTVSATICVTNATVSNAFVKVSRDDTNILVSFGLSPIIPPNFYGGSTNIRIEGEIANTKVLVWAVDNYGVSSVTQQINVLTGNRDITPPVASVTNNPTILNPYGGSIIAGIANDNFAVKEVWVDDGSGTFRKASITSNYFTNCGWVITNGSLSSGYKTVRVYAIDVSNNIGPTNGFTFIVPAITGNIYWKVVNTNGIYLFGTANTNSSTSVVVTKYPDWRTWSTNLTGVRGVLGDVVLSEETFRNYEFFTGSNLVNFYYLWSDTSLTNAKFNVRDVSSLGMDFLNSENDYGYLYRSVRDYSGGAYGLLYGTYGYYGGIRLNCIPTNSADNILGVQGAIAYTPRYGGSRIFGGTISGMIDNGDGSPVLLGNYNINYNNNLAYFSPLSEVKNGYLGKYFRLASGGYVVGGVNYSAGTNAGVFFVSSSMTLQSSITNLWTGEILEIISLGNNEFIVLGYDKDNFIRVAKVSLSGSSLSLVWNKSLNIPMTSLKYNVVVDGYLLRVLAPVSLAKIDSSRYLLIVGQPNGNTLMIKLDSNGNAIW